MPVPEPPTRPGWGKPSRPGFDQNWVGPIINNRPIIGGPGSNIGNTINVGQININQYINQINNRYPNRPSWDFDPGFSRWGIGGDYWYVRWHQVCVHRHYHWYNGCWHGYWGSNWYAPPAWVGLGWGLSSWVNSWGTNYVYYNPYYVGPAIVQSAPYNYSQPVEIKNYIVADSQGSPSHIESSSDEQRALAVFDEGLDLFKRGDYVQSLARFNSALQVLSNDAIVHEVRCLNLFALGDYQAAAAGLNSLLASAPGMDWTTMSGLYGKLDDYTTQLRQLEQFALKHPDDASANFVLAYHYLVLGERDAAVGALRNVVKNQPRDITATRMLEALAPEEGDPDAPAEAPQWTAPVDESKQTDLVGRWVGEAGQVKIDLVIDENFAFTWTAVAPDQTKTQLRGNVAGDADGIELITADQGTLAGLAISEGADAWRFKITGTPSSDPGMQFTRAR